MKALLVMICLVLTACAAPDVSHYKQEQPALNLPQFFSGTTDAWGTFQKRNGEVVKRFHVLLTGTQMADRFVLDEVFSYSDGTTQRRVWTLQQQKNGQWRGTADDIKGEALGTIAGNALNWQYTMLLPVDGTVYEVQFDDWMFLIDGNTMINRAAMSKFGFQLGEVTLFFRKRS